MLSKFVVGTLSTLNTLLSPLAGTPNAPKLTYRLEPAVEAKARCAGFSHTRSGLKLRLKLGPDLNRTVIIEGQKCQPTGLIETVDQRWILPNDLFDDQFLEQLPVNTPFILTKLVGTESLTQGGHSRSRLKLTREAEREGKIAIRIEWVPMNPHDLPIHKPVTVWLEPGKLHTAELPWRKISFDADEPSVNDLAYSIHFEEPPAQDQLNIEKARARNPPNSRAL